MATDSTQVDDQFERQWFNYVLDRVVPASAVQDPNQLQILTDADFEWWWLIGSRTSNLLKVLIKEAATGRDFIGTTASTIQGAGAFNGINFDLLCGTAAAVAAFPLAVPFVMPATRTYTVLFTDSSGAPNTVELVFSGFKLWQKPKTS
jgi:hypothetical protein